MLPSPRSAAVHASRAAALLPLALLSVAWTASLAGTGASPASADRTSPGATTEATVQVPPLAPSAPASVALPDAVREAGRGSFDGDADRIVRTSSTNGIPSAALAAYQRAETVINNADPTCHVTWQLVAALGRVESDHGRFGGSALDADGVATPAILGPVLDGGATAVISDTDAGQLDGNTRYDRAVGPLQFIPSTWAVVGVDADDDGRRDPQDIDDAALASAVYLCSGSDDLSTTAGQKAAVHRYNHSDAYVATVLDVMRAYLAGDFMPAPNAIVNAGTLAPVPTRPGPRPTRDTTASDPGPAADAATPAQPTSADPAEPEPGRPAEPTRPTRDHEPRDRDDEHDGHLSLPVPTVTLPRPPKTHLQPVDEVLGLAAAILQCGLDGLIDNPLDPADRFDRCVTDLTTRD